MITYALYRHVRLDNNTVFYIGIAKGNDKAIRNETEYKRAYSKKFRSKYWSYIVDKTDYRVDIMYTCESSAEIRLKEIELIKVYGRSDLKSGTLVNHTDGGDGRLNPNLKSIVNNGNNWRGKSGKEHWASKSVFQYDMDGKFIAKYDAVLEASRLTNIGHIGIIKCCKDKTQVSYFKNYQWFYEYQGENISPCLPNSQKNWKKVGKYDINTLELITSYNSIIEAASKNNIISRQNIGRCCNGQLPTTAGYVWKYL